MRTLTIAVCVGLVLLMAGCRSRKKSAIEKTLLHARGTLNLANVKTIGPRVQAQDASGKMVDAITFDEAAFTALQANRETVTVKGALTFDDQVLPLEQKDVTSWSRFRGFRSDIQDRYKKVNKFLKGTRAQLDIRKWQD